jgi:hypothetical protein
MRSSSLIEGGGACRHGAGAAAVAARSAPSVLSCPLRLYSTISLQPGGAPGYDGKIEAVQACPSVDTDLLGTGYIFASESCILWHGEMRVLTDEEFMARHYGPPGETPTSPTTRAAT